MAIIGRKRGEAGKPSGVPNSGTEEKHALYLPRISQSHVDLWADTDAKIHRSKQQRGYSNWIEGYVQDVEGKYCISSIVSWRCDKQNYQNLYYRSTAAECECCHVIHFCMLLYLCHALFLIILHALIHYVCFPYICLYICIVFYYSGTEVRISNKIGDRVAAVNRCVVAVQKNVCRNTCGNELQRAPAEQSGQ